MMKKVMSKDGSLRIRKKDNNAKLKNKSKKPRVKVYQIMRPTLTANDELLLPNGKL